jgi:hypothetical protein
VHGAEATHVESVPVKEMFKGETHPVKSAQDSVRAFIIQESRIGAEES